MITSRDNDKLRLVRKLAGRRWREKLGLFACEGEDLVAAATAEPVLLLVAGETVEPRLLAELSSACACSRSAPATRLCLARRSVRWRRSSMF